MATEFYEDPAKFRKETRIRLILAGWILTEKQWQPAEMEGTVLLHLRAAKPGNSPFALTNNKAFTVEQIQSARLDILEYTVAGMYKELLEKMTEDSLL